jgi:hypothetical protein
MAGWVFGERGVGLWMGFPLEWTLSGWQLLIKPRGFWGGERISTAGRQVVFDILSADGCDGFIHDFVDGFFDEGQVGVAGVRLSGCVDFDKLSDGARCKSEGAQNGKDFGEGFDLMTALAGEAQEEAQAQDLIFEIQEGCV